MTGRIWAKGDSPVSVWSVPNLLSWVRILFIPVFVWAMLADAGTGGGLRWLALALFVVGIATDAVDGAIARSRNLITDLGKLLDPIADKGITGAALVALSILGELPWWVTLLILLREIGITVWRLVEAKRIVMPAGKGGKLKTVTQAVAIALAIAPLPQLLGEWMNWVNTFFMAAAFVLTLWSGVDYLVRAYWPRNTPASNGGANA